MLNHSSKRNEIGPLWFSWFTGLVDGEGHFQLYAKGKRATVSLSIKLREDDSDILQEIQNNLHCGKIYLIKSDRDKDYCRKGANDLFAWKVDSILEIMGIIIPHFDKYPLRSKKGSEYLLWREAAFLIFKGDHLTELGKSMVETMRDELFYLRLGPYQKSLLPNIN
jgi:hypothetical protein